MVASIKNKVRIAQRRTNGGMADAGVKAWSRILGSEYQEGNPKQMDQSSLDTMKNFGNSTCVGLPLINAWPAYSPMRKQFD